jgi:type I restriction enzyme S subunit
MKAFRTGGYSSAAAGGEGVSAAGSTSRLKHHLARLFSGGTPETGNARYWSNDESGIAWVAIGDMSGRECVESTEKRITEEGRLSRGLSILPPGTLIYSMYASLGHVAELAMPAVINQALLGFQFKPGVNTKYVKWQLKHLQSRVAEEASSSTQDNLSAEKVRNLPVPLPPLPTQRAIADYLDRETARIDALIAAKERVLALLAEKRRGLITRAVTRGLDPHAPLRDSGIPWLGEIPAHWEIVALRFLVDMTSGATPDTGRAEYWEGEIPWVSPKDMKRDEIADAEDHVSDSALSQGSLRLIEPGAVLIVVRGMILAHSFPTAVTTAPVTINQDMKALRCRESLAPYYLRDFFRGHEEHVVSLADSSAHGTRKLETEILGRLEIALPPAAEQRAIAGYIGHSTSRLDAVRAATKRSIALLKERRSALISAAVTGQIDVGGAA